MKAIKSHSSDRSGKRTRTAAIVVVATALAGVLSACQVNQTMWAACAPAEDGNPFGADSTYVLVCRNGHWEPIMTIGEYLRIRSGEWVEIAPLPQQPQDPPADPAPEPQPDPPPPPKVVEVTGGTRHTCARYDNGTAKCWGMNARGQLGSAGAGSTFTPRAVDGLFGASQLDAGGRHTCAVRSDTTLHCWGSNRYGQLGRPDNSGTENSNPAPAPVMLGAGALTGVVQVSAGESSTCAVLNTGRIYCFGINQYGQLGNNTNLGTADPNPAPALVAGIVDATQVSISTDHTCARRSNGTASCWGRNNYGQLGNATTNDSAAPVSAGAMIGVNGVVSGLTHSCAVTWNARAKCWGLNAEGQLGNVTNSGLFLANSSPLEVTGLTDAAALSSGTDHMCTRTTTARVKCWGLNNYGQMGTITFGGGPNAVPTLIPPLTEIVSLGAGGAHTCAVSSSGAVSCWGLNLDGQLGRSTNFNTVNANVLPVAVAGL